MSRREAGSPRARSLAALVALKSPGYVGVGCNARKAGDRVGATIRPNTAGASTLAAVAAPDWRVEEVAAIVGAEPGVNHSYLRENDWNIWFVATGPDRDHVAATLNRIEAATGLAVLDLPLVRPYHIDLGFALDGTRQGPGGTRRADPAALRPGDRAPDDGGRLRNRAVPRRRPLRSLRRRADLHDPSDPARLGSRSRHQDTGISLLGSTNGRGTTVAPRSPNSGTRTVRRVPSAACSTGSMA